MLDQIRDKFSDFGNPGFVREGGKFKIKLYENGGDKDGVDITKDVTRVSVEFNTGIDTCDLTIPFSSEDYLNKKFLFQKPYIEIYMGHSGLLDHMGVFIIEKPSANMSVNGNYITLKGYEVAREKLGRQVIIRSWVNDLSYIDIVKTIAEENGYVPVFDETAIIKRWGSSGMPKGSFRIRGNKTVQQDSNLKFMRSLAKELGWIVKASGNRFYFGPMVNPKTLKQTGLANFLAGTNKINPFRSPNLTEVTITFENPNTGSSSATINTSNSKKEAQTTPTLYVSNASAGNDFQSIATPVNTQSQVEDVNKLKGVPTPESAKKIMQKEWGGLAPNAAVPVDKLGDTKNKIPAVGGDVSADAMINPSALANANYTDMSGYEGVNGVAFSDNQAALNDTALANAKRKGRAGWKLTFKTRGETWVRSAHWISIDGLGLFSRYWYVNSSTHSISAESAYELSVDATQFVPPGTGIGSLGNSNKAKKNMNQTAYMYGGKGEAFWDSAVPVNTEGQVQGVANIRQVKAIIPKGLFPNELGANPNPESSNLSPDELNKKMKEYHK